MNTRIPCGPAFIFWEMFLKRPNHVINPWDALASRLPQSSSSLPRVPHFVEAVGRLKAQSVVLLAARHHRICSWPGATLTSIPCRNTPLRHGRRYRTGMFSINDIRTIRFTGNFLTSVTLSSPGVVMAGPWVCLHAVSRIGVLTSFTSSHARYFQSSCIASRSGCACFRQSADTGVLSSW